MRCPAIEGIETRGDEDIRIGCDNHIVECVAPLLRGLKQNRYRPGRCSMFASRMRCPAIEGIETPASQTSDRVPSRIGRMRCPAIEGIETFERRRRPAGRRSAGRMRCPAIEGIETPIQAFQFVAERA